MRCDKNSLTEQQREKTTTITDKKNIQHTMFSLPNAQLPPD